MKKALMSALLLSVFCFSASAMQNADQRITDVIRGFVTSKYPAWSVDDIRISFKQSERAMAEIALLPENATIEVLPVYPDFKPVGTVVFPLSAGTAGRSKKYMVRAKVEVIKPIAVAARFIKKGKVLEADDIRSDQRDVALLPQKYFTLYDDMASKEARLSIPENSTIFEWMIGDLPMVKNGTDVTLSVVSAGLTVKVKAMALEDGVRDSDVRVKRMDVNKVISAKVTAPNEVEVKF